MDSMEYEGPTRFELNTEVDISFDAEDITCKLSAFELQKLIKEMDLEADDEVMTMLLSVHFAKRAQELVGRNPLLLQMSESSMIKMLKQQEEVDRG